VSRQCLSPSQLHVVLEAPGVLALFKPSGMTSEELRDKLSDILRADGHADDVTLVSRLDAPTSGVLPVALGTAQSGSAKWMHAQFAARQVSKEYLCLCAGLSLGPVGSMGEINKPLLVVEREGQGPSAVPSDLGKPAVTRYQVCEVFPWLGHDDVLMLLLVRPQTGRKHQIRAHLASIGRPLVGDVAYGGSRSATGVQCPRLFLHCRKLSLIDLAGAPFEPEAPLSAELLDVLSQLRFRA